VANYNCPELRTLKIKWAMTKPDVDGCGFTETRITKAEKSLNSIIIVTDTMIYV
jgi:hypothetical protein